MLLSVLETDDGNETIRAAVDAILEDSDVAAVDTSVVALFVELTRHVGNVGAVLRSVLDTDGNVTIRGAVDAIVDDSDVPAVVTVLVSFVVAVVLGVTRLVDDDAAVGRLVSVEFVTFYYYNGIDLF